MNCGNFEAIITELARDQIVDGHLREAALEHPKYCTVCAKRFANETALTAGLRALHNETAVRTASDKIETTLLDAFRNQYATADNAVSNVVTLAERPVRKWLRYAMAAAAIIVIALVSILAITIRGHKGNTAITGSESAKKDNPQPVPSNANRLPEVNTSGGSADKKLTAADRRSQRSVPGQRNIKPIRHQEPVAAENPDPTAGFISLTIAADYMPLENCQIVKAEVPRAALLAIGLPMNAQRAGETIKAELLVGQDGIARAIRFLQ